MTTNPGDVSARLRAYLAEALATVDAQSKLLAEAREALIGVIAVADRRTVEFDRARAILAKLPNPPIPTEGNDDENHS